MDNVVGGDVGTKTAASFGSDPRGRKSDRSFDSEYGRSGRRVRLGRHGDLGGRRRRGRGCSSGLDCRCYKWPTHIQEGGQTPNATAAGRKGSNRMALLIGRANV